MRETLDIHFEAQGVDPGVVRLTALKGREAISELFDFELELATSEPEGLPVADLLAAPGTLVFARDGAVVRRIHGMIAELVETVVRSAAVRLYRVRFTPRAFRLSVNQTLEIYLDKSVPDILRAVLETRKFESGKDFELRLNASYAPREFVVQYRESDLDFVSRLAEHLGIAYHFEHEGGRDKLVFSDHNDAFPPVGGDPHLELRDRDGERGVHAFAARLRTLPGRVVMRDYNYRTPAVDLTATATVDPAGFSDVVEYGAHFKTPDEGGALALLRAEELVATRKVYEAASAEERLAAGATFVLEGHPAGDLELLLTSVTHRARQAGHFGTGAGEGAPRYENELRAIDKKVVYRPARRTARPRVQGLLTGIVDAAQKGAYAELDAEGRYKVKFMFDTADAAGGQASRPVRMTQPHAGGGYGMHFPLRAGVEVVLSFVNGDPDRPIIAGTVPNPGTPGPVTSGNATRNVIRTGGGNEINIDDTDGSQRIKLSTPHAGTVFQLGSPNGPEMGGLFESTGNYSTVANGVTSTATGIQSGVSKLKSYLTKGSIITEASAPGALDALSFFAEDLPDILAGVASTVTAFEEETKKQASVVAEAAARKQKEAQDGLNPGQRQLESAYEEAAQKQADAEKTAADLDALVKAAGPKPDDALLEAQKGAHEEVEKKKKEAADAKKPRDVAIGETQRKALDDAQKAKIEADQASALAEQKLSSDWARAASNAVANYKAYLAAGKSLYSLGMEIKATLQEAKALVKGLIDVGEVAAAVLSMPRIPQVLSAAPPLPIHAIGSDGVTHVRSEAYTFLTSAGTVGIHGGAHLYAIGAESLVLSSFGTAEMMSATRLLHSGDTVDVHGKTDVIIAGGTARLVGFADGNSVRIVAEKKATFESNKESIKLKALKGIDAEVVQENIGLLAKQKDITLKTETQDVLVDAKRAAETKSGAFKLRIDSEKLTIGLGKRDTASDHGLIIQESDLTLGHPSKLVAAGLASASTLTLDGAAALKTSGAVTVQSDGTATVKGSKVLLG